MSDHERPSGQGDPGVPDDFSLPGAEQGAAMAGTAGEPHGQPLGPTTEVGLAAEPVAPPTGPAEPEALEEGGSPPSGSGPVAPEQAAGDEEAQAPGSPARWVGLATSLALALAAVVTAQVLAAIAEGMALGPRQPQGVPGDVLHRLGYPFGSLGASSALYLIAAVVLVSLPPLTGQRTTDRQELRAAVTLGLTMVISAVIAIGSILAVRYNLHLYSATRRNAPSFVRLQLAAFLLGALGTSVVAFVSSLTAMRLRDADS